VTNARRLTDVFDGPQELLRLQPEELAGILIEVIPSAMQQDHFLLGAIVQQVLPPTGDGWPRQCERDVILAIAESLGWLVSQGLVIRDPFQPAEWYILTRRGRSLATKTDLEAYRRGRELPLHLLSSALAEKVEYLFLRGDYDIAVFQAFKEVEVAVRKACGYGAEVIGKTVMTRAFNTEIGPLSDTSLVPSEREAEMALFVGAIGHGKNPPSHREVGHQQATAARLIVFASHLLDIVEQRIQSRV
jgi:uncharacterized protein (TIGR02391 family)